MEPRRIPAVRESAGLYLIALQRSRSQAGRPSCYQKMFDNCLRWSSGTSPQIKAVTLASIRTSTTVGILICCSNE